MQLIRLILFSLVWAFARSELLLQVGFDIAEGQDPESGAVDINAYLASNHLKWLRYYHVLVSGAPGAVPMRVAHLMFNNMSSWAKFEEENLQHTHALMDNSWVKGRRSIWTSAEAPFPKSAKNERSDETRGGFVFVVQYSVTKGKENEFASRLARSRQTMSQDLADEPGYLETTSFTSGQFQSQFSHMEAFEFNDIPSLTNMMYGPVYTSLFDTMKPFLSDYSAFILTPGSGDHAGLFWPAAGADQAEGPGGEEL